MSCAGGRAHPKATWLSITCTKTARYWIYGTFFWHFAITCTQQAQSPALTSQRTKVKVKWRCGHGREGMEELFSVLKPYEQGHHTRFSGTSLPPSQHIVQPCCMAALCNSGMVKEVLGRRSCVATSIGRTSASVEASDHFFLRDLQLHIEGLSHTERPHIFLCASLASFATNSAHSAPSNYAPISSSSSAVSFA